MWTCHQGCGHAIKVSHSHRRRSFVSHTSLHCLCFGSKIMEIHPTKSCTTSSARSILNYPTRFSETSAPLVSVSCQAGPREARQQAESSMTQAPAPVTGPCSSNHAVPAAAADSPVVSTHSRGACSHAVLRHSMPLTLPRHASQQHASRASCSQARSHHARCG